MTTIRLCSSILRINTPLTTYAPKQEKYVNFNSKRTYRWCIKLFLVLSKMQENYRLLTPNHWAPRLTWGKKIVFLLWISRWVAASVVRPLRIRTRNDFGMMCFIFGSIHQLRRLSCLWRVIADSIVGWILISLHLVCALTGLRAVWTGYQIYCNQSGRANVTVIKHNTWTPSVISKAWFLCFNAIGCPVTDCMMLMNCRQLICDLFR